VDPIAGLDIQVRRKILCPCWGDRTPVVKTRIFMRIPYWCRRDEVTGVWRKLISDTFIIFTYTQNIIRLIKSKKVGWVGACRA
jgi:hypothetical protein